MITFIFEGKVKEKALANLEAEFVKRLGGFVKTEHRIVSDITKVTLSEGIHVLLDERGESYASDTFAVDFLGPHYSYGTKITFLVAGAFGPGEFFKQQFVEQGGILLRLSDFTMPHELARAVLCEQVYRAFTILLGKKYHY